MQVLLFRNTVLILKRLKSLLDGLLNVIERQVKSTTFGVLVADVSCRRLQSPPSRTFTFESTLR